MGDQSDGELPTKKVPIEIYSDKEIEFQVGLLKLRVFLERKEDVPFYVIENLFSCMKLYPRRNMTELTKQIKQYTEETYDYFKKQKRHIYDFEVVLRWENKRVFSREEFKEENMRAVKETKIGAHEKESIYTLKSLIFFLYDDLLYSYPNFLLKENRKGCIQHLFKKTNGYINKLHIKEEVFGKYKKCVLVGYIVSKFGHTMREEQYGKNYNEYLFRAVNKVL